MNEYGQNGGIARNATESEYPGLWRGLVGLWCPSAGNQGGKLIDFSGRGNHGTLTNAPTRSSGQKGNALIFNGVNQSVGIASSSSLDLGQISIITCVRANSTPPTSATIVGRQYNAGAGTQQYVLDFIAGSVLRVGSYNAGESINVSCASTTVVVNGVWYHVAGTYDGVTWRIYINGKQEASMVAGICASVSEPVVIASSGTSGRFAPISITAVGIHNRALSPREIMASYCGASPLVRRREPFSFRTAAAVGGGFNPGIKTGFNFAFN